MKNHANEIATQEKLLISLEDMHNLSSGAFARIRGISKCALRALETGSGARDLEAIAEALKAIILDADMSHNDVGCIAGNHGVQTVDDAWMNRLNAMSSARQSAERSAVK